VLVWLVLVTSAALAGTGAAQAQSSLQWYGQVDVWAGGQKLPGAQRAWVEQGGGMSTSYWGIKGSEDLGNGYKALFTLESFFLPQSGAIGRFSGDPFFSRDAYLGVAAPWGTVTAGRLTTHLFVSTILFNPMVDSYVFSPMVNHVFLGLGGQGVTGDSGWDNALSYTTPDYRGLVGSGMYAFGNTPGAPGQNKWSAQVLYFHGQFAASGVYQVVRFNNVAGDLGTVLPGLSSQAVGQLGATYDFKRFKIYAQYMNLKDRGALAGSTVNTGQLGVSVPAGPGKLLGSYAYSRSSGGAPELSSRDEGSRQRNTWSLGYDYPLSPRTDIYAAYLHDRLTGLSDGDTLGLGIRTTF
jgi:predicted porin